MRMSFKEALSRVTKEEFEKVFHSLYSYKEMAAILNITTGHIVNLRDYWGLSWTEQEIHNRWSYINNNSDKETRNKHRLKTFVTKYNTKNPRAITHPESYIYNEEQLNKRLTNYMNTCMEKYNVPFYSMTDQFKEDMMETLINTMIKTYGVEYPMQVKEIKDKVFYSLKMGYNYDNEHFDSSWELIYYIYCKDHSMNIIREPYTISYNVDDHTYQYYPDFLVEGKLIEVKGDCCTNKDEEKCLNFFGDTNEAKAKAKYKCMIDNVDQILYWEDLKPYRKYVNKTYGSHYIDQFKLSSIVD